MAAEWIINLKNLQDKDLRIRTLNLKLGMIPKEKIDLKNQANANRAKVENAKNNVLNLELQLKKSENRIASHRETIQKLETQSNMVKKNTEYQAMLQQIADYKNKISEEENNGIELLDQIDEAKKTYRQIAENVKFENASLKSEFTDLEKLASDIKAELETLQSQRTALTAPVEDDILKRYEHLLKRSSGQPLTAVHDGICGNCHLRVTPQTLNTAAKGAVAFCDNCQHFIYTED